MQQAKPCPNEKGFVLVSVLLLIPLWVIGLNALLQTTGFAQERLALWFRLDVCALKVMKNQGDLIHSLEKSNKRIDALLVIIYAARSSKPIPVVGGIGAMTEAIALAALQVTARLQEAKLLQSRIRLLGMLTCKSDPFSKGPAFCKFPITSSLRRKPAFFPDLEGPMVLDPLYSFSVNCRPLALELNPPATTLQLTRSPELGYRYVQ